MKVLQIKKGREKSLEGKHPWIFSGAVLNPEEFDTGELVQICNVKSDIYGYGFVQPRSQIFCRVVEFTCESVFSLKQNVLSKLRRALQTRRQFLPPETNSFRLVHAEGDFLPGIVLDIYNKLAVIQFRIPGVKELSPLILDFLTNELGVEAVYAKGESDSVKDPIGSEWLLGKIEETSFSENGMQFWVNPTTGQKTGFFLDQRENRDFIKNISKDRTVLNAFSYSGGFGISALKGGAKKVVNVDSSARAVELCERNFQLNFPDLAQAPQRHWENRTEDVFLTLKNLEVGAFDSIILDPPAFSKSISSVPQASRGYKEINLKAIQKLHVGGILSTFSCSQHISRDLFRKIVFASAKDSGRNVRILNQFQQSFDHPISIYHPEGEYLKGLCLEVL